MHALANMAGDPNCDYALQLIHSVPLGVDEDVLDDPEIWPTKEEFGLEPPELEPACVRAAENYGSADLFLHEVEKTFLEEKLLGMVQGPFTKQQAAEVCACGVEEMAVGALVAIDEGDKIRTIFDASITGVSDRIHHGFA